MKKFLLLFFLSLNTFSQSPFQGIIVEEIDNEGFVDGQTYRIYAQINQGKLIGYWANENNNTYIKTTTSFYFDEADLWESSFGTNDNLYTQRGINTEIYDLIPSSKYTSWMTLGDSYDLGSLSCPHQNVFAKTQSIGIYPGVNSDYLLYYDIGVGNYSGFLRLHESDYVSNFNSLGYYTNPNWMTDGWFPWNCGIIDGICDCESDVASPDSDNLVLLAQLTTTGTVCGLLNLELIDTEGNYWYESQISFTIGNGEIIDCDGNCINDLDVDGICDELDDCVGEYDECGVCNGNGPILYYDCDDNCLSDDDGDGICNELEIEGCTDSTACNFNPEATDDSDCYFPPLYYECTGACINDLDFDGICDELDFCPNDENNDIDNDGICADEDNCPNIFNVSQTDSDMDGFGNPCDNVFGCNDEDACNFNQTATEDDGSCIYPVFGYDCFGNCLDDSDLDGICDAIDNCIFDYNPIQEDSDMDGIGNMCDEIDDCFGNYDECGICNGNGPILYYDCDGNCVNDLDFDSICDELDNCPEAYNPNQEDFDSDNTGDACDGIGLVEGAIQRTLIKVVDVLGRDINKKNTDALQLYIFDDGSVEKKYIVE